MTFLNATEKQQIAEAIRVAEAKTQGELVCVIAPASNDYRFLPLLWSALIALSLPAIVWLWQAWWTQAEIYLAQAALFVLVLLLLNWQPLKMRMVPRSSQRQHAARLAREQFYAQQLHHTRERTGILVFVSVAERYVEILADAGINAKVAPGTWDGIVKNFVAQLRAGRIAPGFLDAVAACATILAEHCPAQQENPNELPNRLIELE
ncbi:MAG: TPM domain-containing protein [Gammaproteobacteria bacterium]|nr:TPM domain-containing protein [Gammaproteobacteria bacterium]